MTQATVRDVRIQNNIRALVGATPTPNQEYGIKAIGSDRSNNYHRFGRVFPGLTDLQFSTARQVGRTRFTFALATALASCTARRTILITDNRVGGSTDVARRMAFADFLRINGVAYVGAPGNSSLSIETSRVFIFDSKDLALAQGIKYTDCIVDSMAPVSDAKHTSEFVELIKNRITPHHIWWC